MNAAGGFDFLTPPRGRPAWTASPTPGRGARHGRLMFLGGATDIDGSGAVGHPGRIGPQTTAAMAKLLDAVAELGGRPDDIVKLVAFHAAGDGDGEAEILRTIRAALPAGVMPTVSLVALPQLWAPGLAVIIKAVAIDNADGTLPVKLATGPAGPGGGAFASGVRCGEFAFVGAQTATDETGAMRDTDDVVAQAKRTIANIAGVLDTLGCDLDDVVKLNTWYLGQGTDADWRRAAEVRSSAFRFPGPGATGVPVPAPYPDGGLIRQECLALRGLDGNRLPRALSWPLGHWDWPIPVSFQQGIRVGRLIVLGGQYSMDERGLAVDPDDMERQIANTMDFIARILAGFGAGLEDLLEVTAFYKLGASPERTPLAQLRFGSLQPPVTEVPLGTMGLERVTIEIEGYAIAPEASA